MVVTVEVAAANATEAMSIFRSLTGFIIDSGTSPERSGDNAFTINGVAVSALAHPNLIAVVPNRNAVLV